MDPDSPDPAGLDETASRAETLIARLKAGRLRPGQFRLVHLLLATTLLAVLLAIPRMSGLPYGEFFGAIYAVAFLFAPMLALAGALYPRIAWRARWWLAGLLLAILFAPALVIVVWVGEAREIPGMLLGTLVCWLPQAIYIAGVWFLLFRDTTRRRPAAIRRALRRDDGESTPDFDL